MRAPLTLATHCLTISLLVVMVAGSSVAATAEPGTQPPGVAAKPTKKVPAKDGDVIAPPQPFAPVDINNAKKDEFKKLNGMTEADADRIIAGRPYGSKYILVTDKIIPEGLFNAVKDHIVAKQPPQKKSAANGAKPAAKP
ncbi:MAG: hypothetical protein K9K38_15010 [Rhodoferax sp.]|nr:hypothetical protein [Rhodoferax sp.]MCF8210690.1 hypothetical protein [Rhodoferax sp.]